MRKDVHVRSQLWFVEGMQIFFVDLSTYFSLLWTRRQHSNRDAEFEQSLLIKSHTGSLEGNTRPANKLKGPELLSLLLSTSLFAFVFE